jgi:hypothetical protein
MIQIIINPTRVERVVFAAGSPLEEDFDLAAWQAIRPLVNQIDRRLRRITIQLTKGREQDGSGVIS